jgi:hypothetical protein
MEFTVKRSEWYRGKGGPGSALLLESSGERCCLGFFANACGESDGSIAEKAYPSDVGAQWSAELNSHFLQKWYGDDPHARPYLVKAEDGIASVNDDRDISDPEREELLTAAFAVLGHTVRFVE